MEEALRAAHRALKAGEVPVGAVVVCDGRIVGSGWNRNLTDAGGRPVLAAGAGPHADLEDAMFRDPAVVDFRAEVYNEGANDVLHLHVETRTGAARSAAPATATDSSRSRSR